MKWFYIIEREDFLTHHRLVGTEESCREHDLESDMEIEFSEIPEAVIIAEYPRGKVKRMIKGEMFSPSTYITNNF